MKVCKVKGGNNKTDCKHRYFWTRIFFVTYLQVPFRCAWILLVWLCSQYSCFEWKCAPGRQVHCAIWWRQQKQMRQLFQWSQRFDTWKGSAMLFEQCPPDKNAKLELVWGSQPDILSRMIQIIHKREVEGTDYNDTSDPQVHTFLCPRNVSDCFCVIKRAYSRANN